MPVITVILPTRDRPALFGRALASVLGQDGADFEVVLVDNNQGTPPLSDQIALQPMLADARVRVVRAASVRNAGAARNAGLAVARGKWITFLDDDDEYAPGKLARQLALTAEAGVPFVLCGYEVQLGARRRHIQTDATCFSGDGLLLDAIWGTPFLFHQRDSDHFFDETLGAAEDLDYALRYLARHSLAAVPNVPEPLVRVHLLQSVGRTNTRHEEHWLGSRRVLVQSRGRFSPPARRRFLLRSLLQRHKGPGGSWCRLLGAGLRLWRTGGIDEFRRVLNAWTYRTGCFRRWLVS